MLPKFDNLDPRIKYYDLILRASLDNIPQLPLPPGYSFAFYQDGDRDTWIDIEKSAKEFSTYQQGLDAWNRYFAGHELELENRMAFVTNENGDKVATATAYRDITGRDQSGDAWLHWVSVSRGCQGRGLSKPLITHVVKIMRDMGFSHAKIPTQSTSWLACKVYLDLGFRPVPENAVHSRDGWRIVKRLTNHPALTAFDAASDDEILNQ